MVAEIPTFLRAKVNKGSNPQRGPLTCMEMENATMAIVRVVQKEVFSQALNVLALNGKVDS